MIFIKVMNFLSLTILWIEFKLNLCKESGAKTLRLKGGICAYGDMDRDLNTDLIVQHGHLLKIYLQGENGEFTESQQKINVGSQKVFCSVGDFNGDSVPDILVSKKKPSGIFGGLFSSAEQGFEVTAHVFVYNAYKPHVFNETFADQLSVMDVNGDGSSDVIGFLSNGTFFCRLGSATSEFFPCENSFRNFNAKPYDSFLHAFVDVTGDLSAEVIFGTEDDSGHLKLQAWERISNEEWRYNPSLIGDLPIESGKYYGAALFADFDADGLVDIGIPWCADKSCAKVDAIKMWNGRVALWQHFSVTGLEGSELVSNKDEGNVVFRVGDFSLDGYPDLIALIREKTQNPMILENVPCTDCISNASRKFELRTSPRLIQPSDVSLGQIQIASFFDLKEDGTLDVLLEYKDADQNTAIDFIRCEDKGDTTFLKVQVFSNACEQGCGSEKLKIGSGIAWHGACVMFNMSDSWGHEQKGTQCQMPQTTHRALHTPFALFGLGRSPNFVDYVHIGSARMPEEGGLVHDGNQHYDLKQIVPNSRVIVVPPKGDGRRWQSRLYLTPSQLIIQSLLVLVSVCAILLCVVAILHFRERRADKYERQLQSHRFHFDAM
uniref:T-cell immunomodulatory protein n=1 Tax=Parascaris univalens TaxID=6257 RepID=A0A915AJ19_PARUN